MQVKFTCAQFGAFLFQAIPDNSAQFQAIPCISRQISKIQHNSVYFHITEFRFIIQMVGTHLLIVYFKLLKVQIRIC